MNTGSFDEKGLPFDEKISPRYLGFNSCTLKVPGKRQAPCRMNDTRIKLNIKLYLIPEFTIGKILAKKPHF
jgi:hypothetical protein